jgi:hypothetical protein
LPRAAADVLKKLSNMGTDARRSRAAGSSLVIGVVIAEILWIAAIAYVVIRLVG